MKRLTLCCLLLAFMTACRGAPSPSPEPTVPLPSPTPTPLPDTPEATAAAFLSAWEEDNYNTMYSLLAPASQASTDVAGFAARYQAVLQTATVLTTTATPKAALQQRDHAQVTYQLTWETALVGTLVTDTVMSLSVNQGRWGVDWSGDMIWPGLGQSNYLYMEHHIPTRANIYDRNGLALASRGTIVSVGVVPGQIEDEEQVLAALTQVTGLPPEEVQERYADRPAEWWAPIADIPAQVSIDHADLLLNTPGIEAREKEARTYWGGGIAPHMVGWVAPIPAEEEQRYRTQGYRGDERVGVAGLERWGESYLAGTHGGTLYLMDASGNPLSVVAEREAVPSRPIYTTFDREFQQRVQEILGDRKGAIIVLDVHTGAVLALASGPSFDPNVFIGPASALERDAVLSNPNNPLINRATQGTYPCGSVFKIVTMDAALESGIMQPDTTFWCPGYWEGLGPDYRKTCWKEEGHGNIRLDDALTASCDVTFYAVGQSLDETDPTILPAFGRDFGLGQPTGLEGMEEVAGLVPSPTWKEETYGEGWWVGDTINLSIGQGYLLVTPLQVARMMAAVANGGTLYRPYVVGRVAPAGEELPEIVVEPEEVGSLPTSPEYLAVIQDALAGVTTDSIGTASHRFTGLSIPVAGKTGTAQAPGAESLPHSWFAAYAPADDPEIAILAMAENAGEGSEVAAPMVRQVVEIYYGLPVTALPPEAQPTPTPTAGP